MASCRKVIQIFINEIWFNGISPIPVVGDYCVGLRFVKAVMFPNFRSNIFSKATQMTEREQFLCFFLRVVPAGKNDVCGRAPVIVVKHNCFYCSIGLLNTDC